MRNVVLNIIDNAIRYTQEGSVTTEVELKEGRLRIVIRDTGDGMTKQDLASIFESFARGGAGMKLWTEGAGLGLYIAKKFVEMHKGSIWAESEGKGIGSTFFVEIPV